LNQCGSTPPDKGGALGLHGYITTVMPYAINLGFNKRRAKISAKGQPQAAFCFLALGRLCFFANTKILASTGSCFTVCCNLDSIMTGVTS
jgi:hypothetical protein